jgi:AmmeMemoRadiSam system protein B/AmmeMemoRadiSam system protein A
MPRMTSNLIPHGVCVLAWMVLCCLGSVAAAQGIRQPLRAGSFYPADAAELRQLIDQLTHHALASHPKIAERKSLRALLLPHAGYRYSGATAAHAARVLSENQFANVLLMGPDHFLGFSTAAIPAVESFRSPLGLVPVSPAARALLQQSDLFQALPPADDREHSLETLLPFLQVYLRSFELIPVVVGRAHINRLTAALAPVVDHQTLVVVSSDLSHFLPYVEAQAQDRTTIDAILSGDLPALLRRANAACGMDAIAILLNMAARWGWRPLLLDYRNSGDTAGDRSRVVGYAAIAFLGDPPMPEPKNSSHHLDSEKGQALVKLARSTLMEKFGRHLKPAEAEQLHSALQDPALQVSCGTFVTLKRRGQLRGCIGNLTTSDPLVEGVRRNAIHAAFHDPRFSPLTERELSEVEIEVSVLTEPQPLAYRDGEDLVRKLRPHVDGVIVRKGHASATFLPQVWEQLPKPEDFLNHLCQKAGMPRASWMQTGLEVSTYQVQYFEEKH